MLIQLLSLGRELGSLLIFPSDYPSFSCEDHGLSSLKTVFTSSQASLKTEVQVIVSVYAIQLIRSTLKMGLCLCDGLVSSVLGPPWTLCSTLSLCGVPQGHQELGLRKGAFDWTAKAKGERAPESQLPLSTLGCWSAHHALLWALESGLCLGLRGART